MATPKKVKLLATLKAGAETYTEGKVYEGENIPEVVLGEIEAGTLTVKVLEYEQETKPVPKPKEEDKEETQESEEPEKKPVESKRVTPSTTSKKK